MLQGTITGLTLQQDNISTLLKVAIDKGYPDAALLDTNATLIGVVHDPSSGDMARNRCESDKRCTTAGAGG